MTDCFEIPNDAEIRDQHLTELQRAQFTAAANYHALRNPGAEIDYLITIGTPGDLPILTDARTHEGFDAGRSATMPVRTRSSVSPGRSRAPREPITRHLRLGHPDATPATTQAGASLSLPRRAYQRIERTAPHALDTVREAITRRRERAISQPLLRYPDAPGSEEIAAEYLELLAPDAPPLDAPPAILFGLHWLQTGGAERWAVESIQLAKDAGFLPVVVTDQNSLHPWLTRAELEGCVVIALSSASGEPPIGAELTRAIVQAFNLRGIVIHHSTWLYRALPWIKKWRSDVPVIDSLHIVEYLGGGFPGIATRFTDFIDQHHTISPELDRWLTTQQQIDPGKIHMAPLAGLTVDASREFKPRNAARPFTIAFVGRLSRQKRPDVFLLLVRELLRQGLPVRAILHGDGELAGLVSGLIARFGIGDALEPRGEDTPVADTLGESDLLVVTSLNEGLTLTTFEAVAAGVPVISADVGSQRTIVQGAALLPRPAREFVRGAAAEISALLVSESAREELWRGERERIAEFAARTDARSLFEELFAGWRESDVR